MIKKVTKPPIQKNSAAKKKPKKQVERPIDCDKTLSITESLINHFSSDNALFNCGGKAYCEINNNGKREIVEVKSKEFSEVLEHYAYTFNNRKEILKKSQIDHIVSVLSAKARFEGASKKIEIRSCLRKSAVYIDLADGCGQIKVTSKSWRIINPQRVKFATRPKALPFPIPEGDEDDIALLDKYLPKKSVKLIVAFIAHCLIAEPPFAVLAIQGEQGSGKTTVSKIIRDLVDPHEIPLTRINKEDNLHTNAIDNQIICIDNASDLSDRMSDTLCRITTGAGFTKRKNYSDTDEVAIQIARPFLLNGISSIISKPDLGDRSIIVNTTRLNSKRYLSSVMSQFDADKSKIFGAILCGISGYLKHRDDIEVDSGHRLIEFLRVGIALERTYGWPEGSFMKEFDAMKRNQVLQEYDCHSLVKGICKLLQGKGNKWSGSAEELILAIDDSSVSKCYSKEPDFPKNVAQLGKALLQLAPLLRDIGIEFSRSRSSTRREIVLTKTKLFDKMMNS